MNKIKVVLENIKAVIFKNPYGQKPPFIFKDDLLLPKEEGVYIFVSNSNEIFYHHKNGEIIKSSNSIFYIGKASSGLANRLTGKMSADYKEKRVWKEEQNGILLHEYPYIEIVQRWDYTVKCYPIPCDSGISAADVEKVLLAAYYVKFGELPISNRTGVPALSRDKNNHSLLMEIANLVF